MSCYNAVSCGCSGSSMVKSPELAHQWLGFEPGSRALRRGFPPPLKRAVARTTCTLRTDTDVTESWDLAHRAGVVISAMKHIHTYMHFSVLLNRFHVGQNKSLSYKSWNPTDNRSCSEHALIHSQTILKKVVYPFIYFNCILKNTADIQMIYTLWRWQLFQRHTCKFWTFKISKWPRNRSLNFERQENHYSKKGRFRKRWSREQWSNFV